MHPLTTIPDAVAALLADQAGVITAEQALGLGMTRGMIRGLRERGRWTDLARGVHAHGPATWTHRAWAGLVLAGPGACLGGLAAAHLWGLAPAPDTVQVWLPPTAHRPRRAGPWEFRRGVRPHRGTPARTSIEATVLDLCAGAGVDEQSHWLAQGLTRRRTTPERLAAALDAHPTLKGRARLRRLLAAAAAGVESPLEAAFVRNVLTRHRLPVGVHQQVVSEGTRSDLVYDDQHVIIELDGRLGHRGLDEQRDARRDAAHLVLGYSTLRFGWTDAHEQACVTARLVGDVLRARGWTGALRPCGDCFSSSP